MFYLLNFNEMSSDLEIIPKEIIPRTLPPEFKDAAEKAINSLLIEFGDAVKAIGFGGSTANGEVIPSWSDVDIIVGMSDSGSDQLGEYGNISKYEYPTNKIRVGHFSMPVISETSSKTPNEFPHKIKAFIYKIQRGIYPFYLINPNEPPKWPDVSVQSLMNDLRTEQGTEYMKNTLMKPLSETLHSREGGRSFDEEYRGIMTWMKLFLRFHGIIAEGYKNVSDEFNLLTRMDISPNPEDIIGKSCHERKLRIDSLKDNVNDFTHKFAT